MTTIQHSTREDKYSLIYSINITCMMVLASVYLSVSNSLPTTSDIKPVEVWLLFNLAYPLLVIMVNVLIQVRLSVKYFSCEIIIVVLQGFEKKLQEKRKK